MRTLSDYLRDAEQAHGHLCAGQMLGVRMAMLGLQKLGIDDPQSNKEDRKRLVTFVEIDRCATDAVAVVPGVAGKSVTPSSSLGWPAGSTSSPLALIDG